MKNTEILYTDSFDIEAFKEALPSSLRLFMRFHSRTQFENLMPLATSLFLNGSRKIIVLRDLNTETQTTTDSFMELMEMHGANNYIKVLEFEPDFENYLQSISNQIGMDSLDDWIYDHGQAVELAYSEEEGLKNARKDEEGDVLNPLIKEIEQYMRENPEE